MTMQAGEYFVGDLCYVMHPEWDEVCSIIIDDHTCKEGEFTLADGRRFAIYNTAYGDGTYRSNKGHSISVDSGSIGCIKVDDITDDTYDRDLLERLGAFVTFDYDFDTENDRGTICIDDIKVYTETDPDEDYYDEEEEDEYQEDEDY